jgi:hypothetical protein
MYVCVCVCVCVCELSLYMSLSRPLIKMALKVKYTELNLDTILLT